MADDGASIALEYANNTVQDIANKNAAADIINISAGFSRKSVYDEVFLRLMQSKNSEQLKDYAKQLNVSEDTISKARNTYIEKPTADSKERNALEATNVSFTDIRIKTPESAYQKAVGTWQKTAQKMAAEGKVIVVAAGNDGGEHSALYNRYKTADQYASLNFLAHSDNVISVGAATSNDSNAQAAPFSSSSSHTWFRPTIVADGTDIEVDTNGDGQNDQRWHGTSFSAPTVSAAIAEMKKANPTLSFTEIKEILTSTANKPRGYDESRMGSGILDRDEAVEKARAKFKLLSHLLTPNSNKPKLNPWWFPEIRI